ncbi:hypothetical protein J5X84_01825 [Streptosporangiaceae bacterium NEAU-GS5]|nr:hypothetical protein [Streptosporangiaceae bacterium NEAU-GS5]
MSIDDVIDLTDLTDPADLGLWVRLVGSVGLFRDGAPVPVAEVGSRKARTLLALLAVHAGHQIGADQVADVLWDGRPTPRAGGNIATLVSRLRAALGGDVIIGGRVAGYRLGPVVRVDLKVATGLVTRAERALAAERAVAALALTERALDLLDDTVVLADQSEVDWAQPARLLHADLLRRARHARAHAALLTGDAATAAAAAQAAVHADPLDEAAYRALMRAYHTNGEPARALLAYQRLRVTLADELGAHPAQSTRHLHTEILQDRAS